MNIVLIGFKSCGKTSVAKELDPNFVDLDRLVEQYYTKITGVSCSCSEIYKNHGEKYFRDIEKIVITSLEKQENCVIASGGGSVLDPANVVCLKKHGLLVYLHVPSDILFTRLNPLPAFLMHAKDVEQEFMRMYVERDLIYREIADLIIYTGNK